VKKSWSNRRWFRVAVGGLIGFLLLGLGTLVYIAYVYMPPENRSYRSAYLARMKAQHSDHAMDAGHFRLHYIHVGTGEPVILLPGGGGWIYDFRGLIEALAQTHSVYALDPPGSGYTAPMDKNPDYNRLYTLDSVDQTLLAFMDRLGLRKASFVGNSWGGGYALYFAQKRPERVNKLVSLDGTGLNLPENWTWELAKWPVLGEVSLKLTASQSSVREALEHLYLGQQVTDEMVREYHVPYTFESNLVAQWVLERNLDWRVTERLMPAMKSPMLIVWGKQDDVLDPRLYLPRWRELAPHAEVVEIAGAGHTPHNAQPERVNRVIVNFLAR
jgi:pimeloyl-ACP methyl ester carboxylesterase